MHNMPSILNANGFLIIYTLYVLHFHQTIYPTFWSVAQVYICTMPIVHHVCAMDGWYTSTLCPLLTMSVLWMVGIHLHYAHCGPCLCYGWLVYIYTMPIVDHVCTMDGLYTSAPCPLYTMSVLWMVGIHLHHAHCGPCLCYGWLVYIYTMPIVDHVCAMDGWYTSALCLLWTMSVLWMACIHLHYAYCGPCPATEPSFLRMRI